MSTCLVTGGAGFLGSAPVRRAAEARNRVICVDNLETGSLANIEHIREPERFVHLGTDIIDAVLRRRADRLHLPPGLARVAIDTCGCRCIR